MLFITPYMWILVVATLIFGPWYPLLGYIVPIVFLTAFISGLTKGRWMCGNLCPRGSFNDNILSKISRKKNIPDSMRKMRVRIPIIIAMMSFMTLRLIQTQGAINKIGMVFVSMCWITTIIAIFVGVTIHPRAWCVFCPMGTIQNRLGKKHEKIKVDTNLCIDCDKCTVTCPMQLQCKEGTNPDCIVCGKCIQECPKKALSQ